VKDVINCEGPSAEGSSARGKSRIILLRGGSSAPLGIIGKKGEWRVFCKREEEKGDEKEVTWFWGVYHRVL